MFVKRCFVILISLFMFYGATVSAGNFSRGCEVTGFGYNGNYLVLNEHGDQTFYLIQNRSNRSISLQRVEERNAFMTPPLTAKLDPQNWGAFASDVQNLHFQCLNTEGETSTAIDCREVLDVCQYPRVKFALSNMGNYWVSINKPQTQVIGDSSAKGIYLKW